MKQMRTPVPSPIFLENDIKASLISDMAKKSKLQKYDDVIINELTLSRFKRRADLVVANASGLHVYEIKSEADSLSRLEGQIEEYKKYFNKVTIVCHKRHTSKVISMVSNDVAIWEFDAGKIKTVQRGKKQLITAPIDLLRLMNVATLKKLARANSLKSQELSRKELENALAKFPLKILREFARDSLANKYKRTSDLFWRHFLDKGSIQANDIRFLSPYYVAQETLSDTNKENSAWELLFERIQSSVDDPFLQELGYEHRDMFGQVPEDLRQLVAT